MSGQHRTLIGRERLKRMSVADLFNSLATEADPDPNQPKVKVEVSSWSDQQLIEGCFISPSACQATKTPDGARPPGGWPALAIVRLNNAQDLEMVILQRMAGLEIEKDALHAGHLRCELIGLLIGLGFADPLGAAFPFKPDQLLEQVEFVYLSPGPFDQLHHAYGFLCGCWAPVPLVSAPPPGRFPCRCRCCNVWPS